MYFSRVRTVKSPTRNNHDDAGIDFYIPEFTEEFIHDLKEKNKNSQLFYHKDHVVVPSGERILIPSGIHVNLKKTKEAFTNWEGIMLAVHNKSGVGTKLGFDRLAEVIDESYQGEVHISIYNTGNEQQSIKANQKMVQLCLEEVSYQLPIELPFDELYDEESTRGTNGFGNSDNT